MENIIDFILKFAFMLSNKKIYILSTVRKK